MLKTYGDLAETSFSRRLSGETVSVTEFGVKKALSQALGCVCGGSSLVQLPEFVQV